MSKLPLLSGKKLAKILEKLGFLRERQRGSHIFYKHPDGRTTVVPNHPGEELDRSLLIKIIKHDLQMSREEFIRYL